MRCRKGSMLHSQYGGSSLIWVSVRRLARQRTAAHAAPCSVRRAPCRELQALAQALAAASAPARAAGARCVSGAAKSRRALKRCRGRHALCVAARPLRRRLVVLLAVRQVLLRDGAHQRVLCRDAAPRKRPQPVPSRPQRRSRRHAAPQRRRGVSSATSPRARGCVGAGRRAGRGAHGGCSRRGASR
jgi:hypothetical protein